MWIRAERELAWKSQAAGSINKKDLPPLPSVFPPVAKCFSVTCLSTTCFSGASSPCRPAACWARAPSLSLLLFSFSAFLLGVSWLGKVGERYFTGDPGYGGFTFFGDCGYAFEVVLENQKHAQTMTTGPGPENPLSVHKMLGSKKLNNFILQEEQMEGLAHTQKSSKYQHTVTGTYGIYKVSLVEGTRF